MKRIINNIEYPITANQEPAVAIGSYNKIKVIGENLLSEYQLKDWQLVFKKFGETDSTIAVCSYNKQTITFNNDCFYILPYQELKDTLLHEIAHALCPNQGHNEVWKAKALELGCNGQETISYRLKKFDDYYYQMEFERDYANLKCIDDYPDLPW